jgi:hypothetical protein
MTQRTRHLSSVQHQHAHYQFCVRIQYYFENEITDISSLKNLVNLRVLNLQNNPITKQQIDELQEALPNCDIRC